MWVILFEHWLSGEAHHEYCVILEYFLNKKENYIRLYDLWYLYIKKAFMLYGIEFWAKKQHVDKWVLLKWKCEDG